MEIADILIAKFKILIIFAARKLCGISIKLRLTINYANNSTVSP